MDEHYRLTYDRREYVSFRRKENPAYKHSCPDCDFKFPTEEEYFYERFNW